MWLQAREVGRGVETVYTGAGRQKAEGWELQHVKGVGLEGDGMKQEEVVAGSDHGEPYLLNEEPRCCLEGMKEDEIILVFEQEQDKIKFPGDEMKRRGLRQKSEREG